MEHNIQFVLFSNCSNLMKGFIFVLTGATPFRRFKETHHFGKNVLSKRFLGRCYTNDFKDQPYF